MADNTLCNNLNTIPIITDNTAITTTQICIGDLLINTKDPDHNLSNQEDAQDPQLVPLLVSRYLFLKDVIWNTQFQMYSLQNQNWYGTWYYPTPKPEEAEEDSTTKPNYNQNQFVISYLQGVPTSFGSNNPLRIIRDSILDQQFILIKNSFWISISHCLKITQNVAFGIFHQFLSY